MTLVDQIRRMVIIVSKLHGAGYVPAGELVDYVTQRMHSQYASSSGCTLRTLQRDFQTIEELSASQSDMTNCADITLRNK